MPTYYVGPGGNDGNAGTSWALRKLTLNGAEDIPVAAGDTVYVGAGTYRETLTCDVSGSAGSPITYIGDYTGAATDGVGGVVRITGSDNDQTAARAYCITGDAKNYRTFRGFAMDTTTGAAVTSGGANPGTNWIIEQCGFQNVVGNGVYVNGASQVAYTIRNCWFGPAKNTGGGVAFNHSALVDNCGHVVENCVVIGGRDAACIASIRIGGITVRNCSLIGGQWGVRNAVTLTAGQTVVVNNCIISGANVGVLAGALGDLVENYNSFVGNGTDRTNTNTGANSNTYPPLFDTRWFFEAVNGGDMVTPWDLASYSQLVNVAGTSPTTTDMRGTSVIGAQREWGALEYDPNLKIEAGSGGGAVSISPFRGNF